MVNNTTKVKSDSPTCLVSIDRTLNNLVTPPIMAKPSAIPKNEDGTIAVPTSKRLGRGAVSSGLTCECGVFAAMACGEWPTQRVSIQDLNQFFFSIGDYLSNKKTDFAV